MKNLISITIIIAFHLYGCQYSKTNDYTLSEKIRINQIGFYPESVKQFLVVDLEATNFEVINANNDIVFSGELKNNGTWDKSGEDVLIGEFSQFKETGSFTIIVDKNYQSYPFEIKNDLYEKSLNAAIKSYYFQRASMPIEKKQGGIYARKSGHPDDQCLYHPSSGKTEGALDSPGGWYDAGDYGKYICNAALSTGQMLNLLEQYPEVIKDGELNIPESGNGVGDLWDELKYELDWILTMQDDDGGVYHKLTALGFSGFIMPEAYDLDRYIIGKGTAASLDFAAVLAQASRLYKNIYPDWSLTALTASKKAWDWALKNNNVAFKNPEDVNTGEYGDNDFSDDFYWAAAELYLTTKEQMYLDHLINNEQKYIHELTNSWKFFVRNVGFHSLLENRNLLEEKQVSKLINGHMELAESILKNIGKNPYRIALERYEWGSNSDILNQAVILCIAHRISGEEKYLIGVEQINDYIYGKNATGYSFLTGFGQKQAMFPHHRPSGADGIDNPVPGFIVGGPNNDRQDKNEVSYTSNYPAKAYIDAEGSYASNEVCINWNAPAVFVLGYLQEVRK